MGQRSEWETSGGESGEQFFLLVCEVSAAENAVQFETINWPN